MTEPVFPEGTVVQWEVESTHDWQRGEEYNFTLPAFGGSVQVKTEWHWVARPAPVALHYEGTVMFPPCYYVGLGMRVTVQCPDEQRLADPATLRRVPPASATP